MPTLVRVTADPSTNDGNSVDSETILYDESVVIQDNGEIRSDPPRNSTDCAGALDDGINNNYDGNDELGVDVVAPVVGHRDRSPECVRVIIDRDRGVADQRDPVDLDRPAGNSHESPLDGLDRKD